MPGLLFGVLSRFRTDWTRGYPPSMLCFQFSRTPQYMLAYRELFFLTLSVFRFLFTRGWYLYTSLYLYFDLFSIRVYGYVSFSHRKKRRESRGRGVKAP